MISGLFIRNYKIFKNQHYIPVCLGSKASYLIGENGVGKSTVLSAIDTLLNNTDINKLDINNEARSSGLDTREPFIVPIFLIEKEKVKAKKNAVMMRALEIISSITWQLETDDFSLLQRPLAEKFVEHKSILLKDYNEKSHYLIPIGFIKNRPNEIPIPSMSIFEFIGDYKEQLEELTDLFPSTAWLKKYNLEDLLSRVLSFIRELYSYIYIPAEISVNSYAKIEGELAQSLLGEDIQTKISKIIKVKDITSINRHLNEYVDSITKLLGNKYHFKKPTQRQSQFTQRHMVLKIIETYFSDRILHSKGDGKDTPINNLSSGEKRQALLNLATAFLRENPKKPLTQTILAFDEPELSLHATACFEQFEKIKRISTYGVQTLVTTHWYGFLPVVGRGTAVYISPSQTHIKALNLNNYRDEITTLVKESQGNYLDTLEVKSNHDLVQSIVASITSKNAYNWLICEGKTDKKYIETHLSSEGIENLVVLSVGGSIALKKIYNYLNLALNDRRPIISGKVLCVLDTDSHYEHFNTDESVPSIRIRRLLLNEKRSTVELVKTTEKRMHPPTEIEDALDGVFFFETMLSLRNKGETRLDFIESTEILDSKVSGGFFNFTEKQKSIIQKYFNEIGKKDLFCNEYCNIINESEDVRTPDWLMEAAEFFCPDLYDY
ncbi:ATP-binding protein [Serratia ureilytica]|uniref:ATP-dependent nuclease n=1 Tax=Serratia TaxID=613 RepID=UPI000F0B7BB8|nr:MULTISPECIES: AAA family ATPase [Serratia]AYU89756.1 hypothetical protein EDY99_05125 [Serratia sp. LS-1]QWU34390.1 ATP-binding protein [Serratia ureilytica]